MSLTGKYLTCAGAIKLFFRSANYQQSDGSSLAPAQRWRGGHLFTGWRSVLSIVTWLYLSSEVLWLYLKILWLSAVPKLITVDIVDCSPAASRLRSKCGNITDIHIGHRGINWNKNLNTLIKTHPFWLMTVIHLIKQCHTLSYIIYLLFNHMAGESGGYMII